MLLWGVLVGAGTGVTSMVLAAVVATRWFDERRGVVLGVLCRGQRDRATRVPAAAGSRRRDAGWRAAALIVPAPRSSSS